MNIALKCPHCKGVITVVAATGLEAKNAECPHCHKKMKIGDFLPCLSLQVDDKRYQLHFGRQWVGRQTSNNTAEIQIPDPSNYMSRRHAVIELTCQPTGIRCTFEEHGTNPTSLQGVELIEDDIVYLNVNDCMMLGDRRMFLANQFE